MNKTKLHPLAEAMGYKSMKDFYKDHPENFLGKDNGYKFGGPIKKYRLGGTDSSTDMGSTMYSTGSGNPISPGPGYDYTGNGYTTPEGIPTTNNTNRYKLTSEDVGKGVSTLASGAAAMTPERTYTKRSDPATSAGIGTGIGIISAVTNPLVGVSYAAGTALDIPLKSWQEDAKGDASDPTSESAIASAARGFAHPGGMWSENVAAYKDGKISKSQGLGNMFMGFVAPWASSANLNKQIAQYDKDHEAPPNYIKGDTDFYGNPNYTQDKIRETQLGNLPMNQPKVESKYGGPMLTQKYGQGGSLSLKNFTNIVGPTHDEGGVAIQKMKAGGFMESNKEVEGRGKGKVGEVVYKTKDGGDYVLSQTLINPATGKDFAMDSTKIQKPGIFRKHDRITAEDIAYKMENPKTGLIPAQEKLRNSLGLGEPSQMKYGGKMKFETGGSYNALSAYKFQPLTQANNEDFIPSQAKGALDSKDFGTKPFDRIPTRFEQMGINFDPATQRFTGPAQLPYSPAVASKGPTTTSFDTSTISPTETKPGWSSYAQLLGPLATLGVGLFGKKGKVTAHQMAPATQDTASILRPNLQASADLAYGNLRAVGKGSGLGKGAYQNMMLQGITGINRNYGNTLADVIAKDTTANAAYKQQANAANQNVNMTAQDKRQQETDMGTTLALQGANALSTTIGGIGKDGTSMAMDYRKYKDLISLYPSIFSGKRVVIKGDQVSVS